jgi:hypothetical protein
VSHATSTETTHVRAVEGRGRVHEPKVVGECGKGDEQGQGRNETFHVFHLTIVSRAEVTRLGYRVDTEVSPMRPISPLFVSLTLCALVVEPARAAVELVARANPMSTTVTALFNDAAVSRDGRFVAYPSLARNVVPGLSDNLKGYDVFLYDRETRSTTLVSRGPGAALSNGHSGAVQIRGRLGRLQQRHQPHAGGATGLPRYLFDRASGAVTLVGRASRPVSLSADR